MNEKNSRVDYESRLNIFDRYLDKKVQEEGKRSGYWGKIIICIVFYTAIMILQASANLPVSINGILSQLEAIISVFLAVNFIRTGFFVGLFLNIINVIAILLAVSLLHNTTAITGLIVALFTMVSISIITILNSRSARQFAEVIKQKEEMIALTEEIIASEEELRQQNDQLSEYYQLIKKNDEKLNYLAYFDTLTELPNRKMILDRLELLVNLSQKNISPFAVVFIDLDNFKKINDTVGHHLGDLLIISVASRLNNLVCKSDLFGRLGGDEFALIIQQNLKDEDILQYVENLRECLEESFNVERYEFYISASFGISIYPQDGSNPDELIKYADIAMYKAKETGKNGIYFFRKEMRDEILQKIDFEKKLVAALHNEEFFLVFQPQYIVDTNDLRGFEALVRWQSPDFGILGPMKFIPLAEEMRLIVQIGEWILRTACRMFKEMLDQYHLEAVISVNISSIQFDDPFFVKMVKNILKECGLQARYLELEITESILIQSLDQTIRILNELKEMGVRIALDDFGTGYSSLRYLQLLPIDTLKIDKSFVDNINHLDEKKQIIGSIISLVHQMDILVVAEGVESEVQLNYLVKENCDCIQGFLLGRPLNNIELQIFFDKYLKRVSKRESLMELSKSQ